MTVISLLETSRQPPFPFSSSVLAAMHNLKRPGSAPLQARINEVCAFLLFSTFAAVIYRHFWQGDYVSGQVIKWK